MKKLFTALFLFLYGCTILPILFMVFIPGHFFECVDYVKEFKFTEDARAFFNSIIEFLSKPLNKLNHF